MSKISEIVENLIRPYAEQLGLEILEVEYAKKSNGMNLTVFIDKPGGVFITDCEKLHHAIDAPLDQLDPTQGASYILNVSSPGADRPLKTTRDFERNLGKEIIVKLYAPVSGRKKFEGLLKAFDEKTLTIMTTEGAMLSFEKGRVALVEPLIRF